MLASHGCDLVCIAAPSDNHAEMALAALDAGTPVLCEKPTAMNAEEARAMRDRAGELDRVALIVHKLRFNPSHIKLAELVRSGASGEVRHAPISNMGSVWANPAGATQGVTGGRLLRVVGSASAPIDGISSISFAGGLPR